MDDFNLDIVDGFLQPILIDPDMIRTVADRRSLLGENPTAASLTSLISEDIPLNGKQNLVMQKVLSEALAWADHPYDLLQQRQLLLCITGKGGMGKTQIPKAILAAMDILGRKNKVILMALTLLAETHTIHPWVSPSITSRKLP